MRPNQRAQEHTAARPTQPSFGSGASSREKEDREESYRLWLGKLGKRSMDNIFSRLYLLRNPK
jgi:hypothetical protein